MRGPSQTEIILKRVGKKKAYAYSESFAPSSRSSDGYDNEIINICLASTHRGARDAKHYAVVDPEAPSGKDRLPLLQYNESNSCPTGQNRALQKKSRGADPVGYHPSRELSS
jgi:hypothetical protein